MLQATLTVILEASLSILDRFKEYSLEIVPPELYFGVPGYSIVRQNTLSQERTLVVPHQ